MKERERKRIGKGRLALNVNTKKIECVTLMYVCVRVRVRACVHESVCIYISALCFVPMHTPSN